jgi:hypothetical protein
MKLAEYLERYPPQLPRRKPDVEDQHRKLSEPDGVRRLSPAPADNQRWFRPTGKSDPECHLWVIDASGIPYILEVAAVVPPLASGRVKHTNLTGGVEASCGGELWFDTPTAMKLYINGCSGRYGPTSQPQLEDAVAVFSDLGYEVVSFGWDHETDAPMTVLLT